MVQWGGEDSCSTRLRRRRKADLICSGAELLGVVAGVQQRCFAHTTAKALQPDTVLHLYRFAVVAVVAVVAAAVECVRAAAAACE